MVAADVLISYEGNWMAEAPFVLNPRGPILEVTLSKGKANAISAEDSRELNHMWEAFRDHPEQRFAILTGKGEKFFCAGWDLKNVAVSGEASDSDYGSGGFGGLNYPRNLYKPIICAVTALPVVVALRSCSAATSSSPRNTPLLRLRKSTWGCFRIAEW